MKNKWVLFIVVLALIAVSVAAIVQLKSHPRLGKPGIIATPIPDSVAMNISLPEKVLNFISTNVPEPQIVLGYLPKDSSYAERRYTSSDVKTWIEGTLILMGTDRTSIHNADYCLRGQGFDPFAKSVVNLSIAGAQPYQLPVSRWDVAGEFQQPDGQKVKVNGVYVFWFVADSDETPDHFEMMKKLAVKLLKTGMMERWAYASYFSPCLAGQEDATFEQMKKLIAASVPQFQLPPKNF